MSKSGGFSVKRTVCAAATVALATSGLIAGTAIAADSPLTYGDIDQTQPRKLTIHKFESGSLTTNPISERTQDGAGDGVKGVGFKLYPVAVDLTTPEGWDKVAKHTTLPATVCDANGAINWAAFTGPDALTAGAGAAETITTGDGGIAVKDDIALGAYIVCEQDAQNPTNKANNPVSVLKKSAPFLVTVPRAQADGNGTNTGWLYDVHAYPKNTVLESPTKATKINSVGLNVADGIEYSITMKVPNLLDAQHFKYFSLIDQMPEALKDAKVASVTVDNAAVDLNTHYTVDYVQAQDFLAVNFTTAGLTHLKGKANTNVVVTIKATVEKISANKMSNTAYFAVDTDSQPPVTNPPTPVDPHGPGEDPTPKVGNPPIKTSNKTATTWGDLKIRKHDAAQTTQGLAGAQFQVFEPADQQVCVQTAGNAGVGLYTEQTVATAKKVESPTTQAAPIAVGADNQTTFTTEKGGEIVISGLHIGTKDAAAGAEADAPTSKCYVVEEIKAPAGYVKDVAHKRTYAVMVEAGTSQTADLDMANTKVSVPHLPLTGASGRVLLMTGGAALVLGSMGFVMVSRRRKSED